VASAELRIYRDLARERRLPLRLRRGAPGAPLIVFSPGFGGTCWDYDGLTLPWHEEGYHVAQLEHPGSAFWQALRLAPLRLFRSPQQLRGFAHTPAEKRNRPLDMLFVLDQLERELKPSAVGLAGHSFGSYTALAAATRASAVVALSPHPPGWLLPAEAYPQMTTPCLMVTGTRDRPYEERLEAYRALRCPAELLVVEGAKHMDFAGWGPRQVVTEAAQAGLKFWRRWLEGRQA